MKMTFEILDTSQKDNVVNFERLLYKSYGRNDPDGWVFNNYQKDGDRLKPFIGYDDLVVYVARLNNDFVGAGTINFSDELQLVKMGFDMKITSNTCEGINLVTDNELVSDVMKLTSDLMDFIFNDLKSRGVKKVVLGCEKKVRGLFYMLGFDVLEQNVTFDNGVIEYLAEYRLED